MKPKATTVRDGRFGPYGGRYVPEMLLPALEELERAHAHYRSDPGFRSELDDLLANYAGRPTPLYFAENLTAALGGCRIYLKLEGMAHTGAHKINNVLGQMLLAKKMGKRCVVAETGAGQHGLATAAAAAKFGLDCKIFMGTSDIRRQYPNVFTMGLMGAEVIPVPLGSRTLKEAVNAAMKYWISNLGTTHYLLGSALGPHPYPLLVREFQSVIGREVARQVRQREGKLPRVLIACVGGGSNSLGLFHPFISKKKVQLIGVEAAGRGRAAGDHAVRFGRQGRPGIVQGYRSFFLQDRWGQVLPTHSISAGLDYAGVSPELAYWRDRGRIAFAKASDRDALAALRLLCRQEGILPALESAHAVAHAVRIARRFSRDDVMVVNISGRGEKDLFITARALDGEKWLQFLKREAEDGE